MFYRAVHRSLLFICGCLNSNPNSITAKPDVSDIELEYTGPNKAVLCVLSVDEWI